jgi:hypothetical protein
VVFLGPVSGLSLPSRCLIRSAQDPLSKLGQRRVIDPVDGATSLSRGGRFKEADQVVHQFAWRQCDGGSRGL